MLDSLATEQLLEVEVPPRAAAIRVLMTELNRVSSHLVALATNGMDIGAISMMMYGFRERELILAFFEKTTGLRMNHTYPTNHPPQGSKHHPIIRHLLKRGQAITSRPQPTT